MIESLTAHVSKVKQVSQKKTKTKGKKRKTQKKLYNNIPVQI